MIKIPTRTAASVVQTSFEQLKKPIEAVTRPVIDVLEKLKNPLIDLRPPSPVEDLTGFMEKVSYKKSLEEMTPKELFEEGAKLEEQLREASTGRSQDPKAAEDARWRQEALKAEQARRELEDPNLSPAKYEKLLGGLSDAQLKDEVKRLEAQLKDATSGAHTNEADAEKIEAKLDAAKSEKAQRVVDDPKTNILSYLLAVPELSDKALLAEQTEVRAAYEATLKELSAHPENARALSDKIEALARKLNVLDNAVEARGIVPEAAKPEVPAKVEVPKDNGGPEGAGGTEEYVIVPGDTLSAIAMEISEMHGGTPDWQTVMAELVKLNGIENPDLIIAGEPLKLPVYEGG